MKKLLTLLSVTLFSSIAIYAGESNITPETMTRDVVLEISRSAGVVNLGIYFKDIDNIENVVVERSSASTEGYRQVKMISSKDLDKAEGFKYDTQDMYPLPSNTPSYYRLVIITKEGAQKVFSGVLID